MAPPQSSQLPAGAARVFPRTHSAGLQIKGATVESNVARAYEAYVAGRYTEALELCRDILRCHEWHSDALQYMCSSMFQLGDYVSTQQWCKWTLARQPFAAWAHVLLARVASLAGDTVGAEAAFAQAVQSSALHEEARCNLGAFAAARGDVAGAQLHYHAALSGAPRSTTAHTGLGQLALAQHLPQRALEHYAHVVALEPASAMAWNGMASAYVLSGDTARAIQALLEVVRLSPTHLPSYTQLATLYAASHQPEAALQCVEVVLRARPDDMRVVEQAAHLHVQLGRVEDALAVYRTHGAADPDMCNNMANLLKTLPGREDEALGAYQRALVLDPSHKHALNNLGTLYRTRGNTDAAQRCYEQALHLHPTFAPAMSNLGGLLHELGFLDRAIEMFQGAIALVPSLADAHMNLGNVFKEKLRHNEAIHHFRIVLQLQPACADGYTNLASVYKDTHQYTLAIQMYRTSLSLSFTSSAFCNLVHTMHHVCDWTTRDELMAQVRRVVLQDIESGALPALQPFHALVVPFSAAEFRRLSEAYSHHVMERAKRARIAWDAEAAAGGPVLAAPLPALPAKAREDRRITIGYVSSDFNDHPLAHLMLNVFRYHSRTMRVLCIALSPSDGSSYRKHVEETCEEFVDVSGLDLHGVYKVVRALGVDILINLNGFTRGAMNELFALRPCPVQILYLGFPGTLGAPYIDYFVSDHVVTPPELHDTFTERLLLMPHSYFVNDHKQAFAHHLTEAPPTRAQYGLPEDRIVLCNFNQLYKIDPCTFGVWCNILKRVPNAVLWLLRFPAEGEANIRREAEARGVGDRIIFTNTAGKEEHVRRACLADLCIDTPLCNGHTTSCDVLWSGTPIITMSRECLASRVASSLLHALDCAEMVVSSYRDYEDRVVALCEQPDMLRALRAKVARNRLTTPLFDTRKWVADFETLLTHAWKKHLAGEKPRVLSLPRSDLEHC